MAFVQRQGKAPHLNPLPGGEGQEGARHKQRDSASGYDDHTERPGERANGRASAVGVT
jgi:hypothetical protein